MCERTTFEKVFLSRSLFKTYFLKNNLLKNSESREV